MRRRRHKYNNIIAKLKADADAAALKQSETTAKLRDEVRPYSPIPFAHHSENGRRETIRPNAPKLRYFLYGCYGV